MSAKLEDGTAEGSNTLYALLLILFYEIQSQFEVILIKMQNISLSLQKVKVGISKEDLVVGVVYG